MLIGDTKYDYSVILHQKKPYSDWTLIVQSIPNSYSMFFAHHTSMAPCSRWFLQLNF